MYVAVSTRNRGLRVLVIFLLHIRLALGAEGFVRRGAELKSRRPRPRRWRLSYFSSIPPEKLTESTSD